MRTVSPKQLTLRLLMVLSILATLLSIGAPKAEANEFGCPGPHNVDLSISRHGVITSFASLEWLAPPSYYEAVFCSDLIGFDVRNAHGESLKRYEWTPLELLLLLEKHPNMLLATPSSWDPAFLRYHGCEWTAVLYTRAPGDANVDNFKYTKTVEFDHWGLPGCWRLNDRVRPIPQISFAPVVSENPPSIDP